MKNEIETVTLSLFLKLDNMLIELLNSLTPDEWQSQIIAKHWRVKDVASHLLDGNLRGLSISRDRHFGEPPGEIHSHRDLVSFLNNLNMTWTSASERLSPQVLTNLLAITGTPYFEHLETLDPHADAVFSVAWAGQQRSPNWFHIAREYTEKFLHQQQIRDAVNKPGIMTKEFYYPFLDTLMFALPFTFKNTVAPINTVVAVIIPSNIGGRWNIIKKQEGWELVKDVLNSPDAIVTLDPDTAWKLFSKSRTPEQVSEKITITGDQLLGEQALKMVSVMA